MGTVLMNASAPFWNMSIAAVYINRDTRLVLSRWRRLIGIKPSAKKFQIIFYPLYLIPTVLNAFKLTYVTPALPRPPLPKSFFDFDAKTVLIQEPYALPSFSSVVANVPPCFSSYHQSLMTMFTGLQLIASTSPILLLVWNLQWQPARFADPLYTFALYF
jgi:hypothetical protein